jgi:hypothetical protein
MAQVVLDEVDRALVRLHFLLDKRANPELISEPDRYGFTEDLMGLRECLEGGLQNALKLKKGLFIEAHRVELVYRYASLSQTILYGVCGERRVVLLAGEAFFFGSGYDHTVTEYTGSRVVIEARYS